MSDICDPMDCSLPGSSVNGIFPERILEWVAISFSRRSSWPRDQTESPVSPALQGNSWLLGHLESPLKLQRSWYWSILTLLQFICGTPVLSSLHHLLSTSLPPPTKHGPTYLSCSQIPYSTITIECLPSFKFLLFNSRKIPFHLLLWTWSCMSLSYPLTYQWDCEKWFIYIFLKNHFSEIFFRD